jgi:FkbM family methyltransferase
MTMRCIAKWLMSKIPFSVAFEIFYQSARRLGVTAYQAIGDYGPFFGSLADQAAIKPYLRDRTWSPNIVSMVERFFADKPSGTFYDVGANVGLTLIPIARNNNIRCVAFEPDPENFILLSANIAANGCLGIELHNAAVADKPGKMGFVRNAFNSGDHHLSTSGEILVECFALDELVAPAAPFAIKIDTQGAEPLIFAGGQSHLAKASLIICEFWPWGMKRMGAQPDVILDFVRYFPGFGMLAQHNEVFDKMVPAAELIPKLEELCARGGKDDDVDLVLVRDA